MGPAPVDDGTTATVHVNRPTVVAEVFDGEGVIVHLGTGLYYSLDEVGTVLWARIESGGTIESLTRNLADGASMTADEAARTARTVLAALEAEDLIIIDGTLEPADRPPARTIELRRFSDLQDVLLVDPIHDLDLDGDGWPINAGSGVGRPRKQ